MSVTTTGQTTGLTIAVAGEIRAWMGRRGVRQSQLARDLGENEQWLSVRLRGTTPLNFNDAERIASALGIHVVDLLPAREREVTVTSLEPSTALHEISPFGKYPRGGRPSNRRDPRRPTSTGPAQRSVLARTA